MIPDDHVLTLNSFLFLPTGGKFGGTNKPTAGPQVEKALPKGKHALQLHSLGTPNGVKVTALLEELNLKYGIEYDAYTVNIFKGAQFDSGFVDANPNSKIPALLHYKDGLDKPPVRVFETSAIMIYLCETFDKENVFYPKIGDAKRAECLSWVMFTQGSAPFLGGGFGHFYAYAPEKYQYPIDRYTMEVKRQLDVLDRHLGGKSLGGGGPFLCGNQITIADLACWPWYGNLVLGTLYDAKEFLNVKEYTHVVAWAEMMKKRTGVDRGRKVNRSWGPEGDQLLERHSAQDFKDLDERVRTTKSKGQ
jgi:GST-like protein